MNNHFEQLIDENIGGIKVILGSYSIHLVEGDTTSVKNLI